MKESAQASELSHNGPGLDARAIALLILPLSILSIPLVSSVVVSGRLTWLTDLIQMILMAMLAASLAAVSKGNPVKRSPALLVGFILPVAMWISLAVSPSEVGTLLTIFATGSAGLLLAMTLLDEAGLRTRVAIPLLLTSGVQGLLVIAQTVTDQPIGLTLLDPDAGLRVIDGLLRSRGLMHHVYEATALALTAAAIGIVTASGATGRLRWLWVGAVGLAGTTVGLTHSRSALLGVVLMVPFLATASMRDPRTRSVAVSFLAGCLIAALFTSSAWLVRGDHTVTGDLDDMSLGRVTLMKQALEVAIDHPVVGVGPGRYLDAIRADYELDPNYPFMVHNLSLAIAAENGMLAGLAVTALLIWVVAAAVRRGKTSAALALSISGFLVFDVLHYNRPVGLMLGAIWLGALHITDPRNRARPGAG